jgi:Mg-chelatase subunit ChlD
MMQKVHISIVLDRSGSMEDARCDAVGIVNGYLHQVRADNSMRARLSVVTFDTHSIDSIRDREPVESCREIGLEEYLPRGGTPLLDAVGYSAALLDCLSDKDERRIMAIMTDGQENSSREYTFEKIKMLLDRKQREDGWLVLYLGAGHDSWSQARQIGIPADHTADFSVRASDDTAHVLYSVGRRFMAMPAGRPRVPLTSSERSRLRGRAAGVFS